jgi:hypothetical protein
MCTNDEYGNEEMAWPSDYPLLDLKKNNLNFKVQKLSK